MMELLVSIAVLGVVSLGFLGALVAGYRSVQLAGDQTMAESLTRTELENIKSSGDAIADYTVTVDHYRVTVTAENVTIHYDPLGGPAIYQVIDGPASYQVITVTISDDATGKVFMETKNSKAL